MCPCKCVNHVFNGLVEKMVDDLGQKKNSLNIIIGKNIGIFIWELNKVHDIGVRPLGDKENKWVVPNQLKSFTKGSLVHPYTLSTFTLYN